MSKSSRLLITAGCSHSDSELEIYKEHDITVWPSIVAKELDVDLLNLAKKATSNDYISNVVMDAVLDNFDRDIIVMVLWTAPNRLNIHDYEHYIHPIDNEINLTCNFTRKRSQLMDQMNRFLESSVSDKLKFDKYLVNYNLRIMWKLNEFLEARSIKYYQANIHSAFGNIIRMLPGKLKERQEKIINYIPENRYFSKKYFTTQSWRSSMSWINDPDMTIYGDAHPNQNGHNWIAETFLLQTQSRMVYGSGSNEESNFIYD